MNNFTNFVVNSTHSEWRIKLKLINERIGPVVTLLVKICLVSQKGWWSTEWVNRWSVGQ